MLLEALIAFLLVRHLRRSVKIYAPNQTWDKAFVKVMFGILVFFLISESLQFDLLFNWLWHLFLVAILFIIYGQRELLPARTVVYAVLPFIVVSLLQDILKTFLPFIYNDLEDILEFSTAAAIIWMVAMWIISNKQHKALEKERRLRLQEEEQMRQMEVKKMELEAIVAERTSALTQQKEELQKALEDLQVTQAQLIQAEKMASLGELTAGIAHEIQNPLNFINNFSEVNIDLAAELKTELGQLHMSPEQSDNITDIIDSLTSNGAKIVHHGKRADAIVQSMLQHSKTSTVEKEWVDANALADEYLRLSYHGTRAKDKSFNAILETHFDPALQKVLLIPQDMGRVLLNLVNNAFYAVNERRKKGEPGYEPKVIVRTRRIGDKFEIAVTDNGVGIKEAMLNKIFQPFFTTKPSGEGTGLGLSLSYDIITKGHGGELKVETKEGEGTTFLIILPYVKQAVQSSNLLNG